MSAFVPGYAFERLESLFPNRLVLVFQQGEGLFHAVSGRHVPQGAGHFCPRIRGFARNRVPELLGLDKFCGGAHVRLRVSSRQIADKAARVAAVRHSQPHDEQDDGRANDVVQVLTHSQTPLADAFGRKVY